MKQHGRIKSIIPSIILCLELIIVFSLFIQIFNKLRNNKKYSITTLDSTNMQFKPIENLKYFYELGDTRVERIKKDWLDYEPTYNINKDGLNERYNYSIKKDDGVYRILAVGDSFTFGIYVSTPENWTELLEDMLNRECLNEKIKKIEVINIGVPGYDTQYEYQRYILRGKKYNPDLVIWTFLGFESSWEKIRPIRDKYFKLFEKDERYFLETKIRLLREGQREANLYTKDLVALSLALTESHTQMRGEKAVTFQTNYLEQFNTIYKGKTLYVDLSEDSKRGEVYYFKNIFEKRLKLNKSEYYHQPEFIKHPGDYRLPDYHFNKLGNKLMEESVFEYLKKNNIIACSP